MHVTFRQETDKAWCECAQEGERFFRGKGLYILPASAAPSFRAFS